MINALANFDKRTAAGLLARAALFLENEGNPAAVAMLDNEQVIRDALLREVRAKLGVDPNDNRPETIEKLGDFLDEESDKLIDPPDTRSALERLAERGDLASDLYEINIIANIAEFHGRDFTTEKDLIERTIRNPDREQHFGEPVNEREPFLISLFARRFKTPWPYKDFTMLAAGQRNKLVLHVHQAWRLYPAFVDDQGNNLVELLRRFADEYGTDIEVSGKKDHFFLSAEEPLPTSFKIDTHGKIMTVTVSQFTQNNPITGKMQASLIVAINLDRYRATLQKMRVRQDQMV